MSHAGHEQDSGERPCHHQSNPRCGHPTDLPRAGHGVREVQVSEPSGASQITHMLHVRLQPQVGSSEEDQSKNEAEVVAWKERVAEISESDYEDTRSHHENGMQKHLRERVGLMNDKRTDDDHEDSK